MRIFHSLAVLLALVAFGACLPKTAQIVSCTEDSDCAAVGPGLRCDQVRQVCTCEGSSGSGCGVAADAGSTFPPDPGLDASPSDSPASIADSSLGEVAAAPSRADTEALPPSRDVGAVDARPVIDGALVDQGALDIGADTRIPDAEGSCAANSDCRDPSTAFCVGSRCVGCQLAGNDACAGPTGVCNQASGVCVACTADSHCAAPAAPICDKATSKCVGCSTDPQCQGKNASAPACRADGQCVECTAKAASSCGGATPVCDTGVNACVQCVANTSCAGTTALCGSDRKCHGCSADSDCAGLGDAKRGACATSGACVECTAKTASACTGATPVCDVSANACVQCVADTSCAGTTPLCGSDHKCHGCSADSDCAGLGDAKRGACATSGACVECTAKTASACTGATPVCDSSANGCVQCVADTSCAGTTPLCGSDRKCHGCSADSACAGLGDAKRGACATSGACVECTAKTASACTGATPVCDSNANACVQCVADTSCAVATPLCGSDRKCHGCSADNDCAGLDDAKRGVCATSGACVECTGTNATKCLGSESVCNTVSNACVECVTNATCAGSTPICATASNTCRACAAPPECAAFVGHTACAATGACVECTDDSTCSGTKPVCQIAAGGTAPVNTCRACVADSECSAIGPGVCMHDGHCATDAETVYVGSAGTVQCSASNSGTYAAPVCSLASGVGLAKMNGRPLVVVRGTLAPASTTIAVSTTITIVGRTGATLIPADAGADCITITGGEVFLRNLAVQGAISPASGMGINVAPPSGATATLHMETCAVRNNPGGGILINGAAFDIRNTVVSGNGPGTVLATGLTWGGIYVQSIPTSGLSDFTLVSIQSNNGGGLTCTGAVQGSGLLATLNTNTVSQIGSLCAVTSCPAASSTCGAQAQPQ